MSSTTLPTIFVIGGTGAQGLPVIRGLVSDGKYHCRVLTRDTSSHRAKALAALPNVSFLNGTFANEATLRAGFAGCHGAFVNIDGFNAGEKTEMYWAIRSYELALETGVRFFVYGNLDYGYKKSGYRPEFRTGHYDGKGRVGEWILQQNKDNSSRMKAALFTSGPYIEMAVTARTPMTPTIEDGIVTWRVPLGKGAVPHVALDDCAFYVRWLFDNPERANGFDLEVAVDHITYDELASAFQEVTGHPARYIDTDLDTYWESGPFGGLGGYPAGYNASPDDAATMSLRDNFTGFWNLWKASAGNSGVVRRDYKLLDEIHPGRIRSVKEWLTKEEEKCKRQGENGLLSRLQGGTPVLRFSEESTVRTI